MDGSDIQFNQAKSKTNVKQVPSGFGSALGALAVIVRGVIRIVPSDIRACGGKKGPLHEPEDDGEAFKDK